MIDERSQPKPRSLSRELIGTAVIGTAMIVLVLILAPAFLAKPYRIPSVSMEPTLMVGQRVLVSRVNYRFGRQPERGNIVVFHPSVGADTNACGVSHPAGQVCPQPIPERARATFIKRIVGVPGDTVSIRNGFAVVNGKEQRQPFIKPCAAGDCNFPRAARVPPDHYFMMGDNRGESDDSRFWGPIPRKWIIGQAFWTYWPPKRAGTP